MAWLVRLDPPALLDARIWLSAYGHVFFSLGIGAAALVAYGRNLPAGADLARGALQAVRSEIVLALTVLFIVSGTLGYLGSFAAGGAPVTSPGVAFIAYAAVLGRLPAAGLFGFLFFFYLVLCAMNGQIFFLEGCADSLAGRRGLKREGALFLAALPPFLAGALLMAGPPAWLALADYWTVHYGLTVAVLLQCLILGWGAGALRLRSYINANSSLQVGRWWDFLIRYWTPAVLAFLLVLAGLRHFREPFGGLTPLAQAAGWAVLALALALAAAAAGPACARVISRWAPVRRRGKSGISTGA